MTENVNNLNYDSEPDLREQIKDTAFTDYTKFQSRSPIRNAEKANFFANQITIENPDYPELDRLYDEKDDRTLTNVKHSAQKEIAKLQQESQKPGLNSEIYGLYADRIEGSLTKIYLVEAAEYLRKDNNESTRRAFTVLNERLHGPMDPECFYGLVHEFSSTLDDFVPKNETAKQFKSDLQSLDFFKKEQPKGETFKDSEIISKLGEVARQRFGPMLDVVPDTDDSVRYDAAQSQAILQDALIAGGYPNWQMEINEKFIVPDISSIESRTFRIPPSLNRTAAELRRLIVHEVGTHIARAENGNKIEYLYARGTADYLPCEEGLGVILECAIEGNFDNPSYRRATDRYLTAGLALGTDGEGPRDAHETFEILRRMLAIREAENGEITPEILSKTRDQAYGHIENAFRGTNFYMKGIIYSKLKVYYDGLVDNIKYFKYNVDNLEEALDMAMLGKYNHTNIDNVKTISLIAERKLNETSASQQPD